jgi:hypothetical protein
MNRFSAGMGGCLFVYLRCWYAGHIMDRVGLQCTAGLLVIARKKCTYSADTVHVGYAMKSMSH